ncbi:MAG: hypothetical protein HZC02_00275 [Candidatus Levybacteria bacterium]|nr:hypothetical protein [Candidatus Levybacteria bacterium]
MPKKVKKLKKLSARKMHNQKYLLLGIIGIFLVLFLAKIELLRKPELAHNVVPLVSPVETQNPVNPTIKQIAKKIVVYPSLTPTSTPTPSLPPGKKRVNICGHIVDGDLKPIYFDGMTIRVENTITREVIPIASRSDWCVDIVTPGDWMFIVSHFPNSGEGGYSPYAANHWCGNGNCGIAPTKEEYGYSGYNDDSVLPLMFREGETSSVYFMFKKY